MLNKLLIILGLKKVWYEQSFTINIPSPNYTLIIMDWKSYEKEADTRGLKDYKITIWDRYSPYTLYNEGFYDYNNKEMIIVYRGDYKRFETLLGHETIHYFFPQVMHDANGNWNPKKVDNGKYRLDDFLKLLADKE